MQRIYDFYKNEGHGVSDKYAVINTRDLIEHLESAGHVITKFDASRVKDKSKEGFQKHLIRLKPANMEMRNGLMPELIISNSYDGTSSLKIKLGLFRLVCSNGLIVGTNYQSISLRHSSASLDRIIPSLDIVASQSKKMIDQAQSWEGLKLTEAEALEFAGLIAPQFGETVLADSLLRARRAEDQDLNLWTVFNRIQENVLRGGFRYISNSGVRTGRDIKSLDRVVSVNQGLWDAASTYFNLIA